MANNWTGHFKIITPTTKQTNVANNQDMSGGAAYNNYSWYQRMMQGSGSRITKYREYDMMDADVEVSRALDTIAEEMTGNNSKTNDPIEIEVLSDDDGAIESSAVLTVKAALRRWNKIHKHEYRLFKTARLMVKYGDVFFRKTKSQHGKWVFIHPKNVVAAIVDAEDITTIRAWQVKIDREKVQAGGFGASPMTSRSTLSSESEILKVSDVVRFTLNDDMSDTAPFGESILQPVYKSHKQKELLEDAIIIYRVQRAPERRVFYIDVGKMPPQRVKTYLETIKNEIKQKKVPTVNGGQMEVDSVYNPQSMSEDFFFASRPDSRGSRVETLPGGQGLGELSDLEYFQKKVWRGMKVPASYMSESQDGGSILNDGKVGVAYIQELRFSLFVERLQGYIEDVLDEEFKTYLRLSNIRVDETTYRLRLPTPSNFGKYRQSEMDNQLLSSYGSADGIEYLSKRFVMKRFLQMSDEEIITNERMKKEELGIVEPQKNLNLLYGDAVDSDDGGIGGDGGFGGDMTVPADSTAISTGTQSSPDQASPTIPTPTS